MKYKKRPVTIEASQWFGVGDHVKVISYMEQFPAAMASAKCDVCGKPFSLHGWIQTFEGGHRVCPLDWIIRGIKGEFYPCKPDIFEATYEPVLPYDYCELVKDEDC